MVAGGANAKRRRYAHRYAGAHDRGSASLAVSQGGREISRLRPPASFGELALIRAVPRTASVTAMTDVELQALDRAAFLLAVTASPGAADEAARVAAAHMERDRLVALSGGRS